MKVAKNKGKVKVKSKQTSQYVEFDSPVPFDFDDYVHDHTGVPDILIVPPSLPLSSSPRPSKMSPTDIDIEMPLEINVKEYENSVPFFLELDLDDIIVEDLDDQYENEKQQEEGNEEGNEESSEEGNEEEYEFEYNDEKKEEEEEEWLNDNQSINIDDYNY